MAKLLIKSIMLSYHAVENLYNTRYDDLKKPMKQTSFTVKKLGGKPSWKAIHYSKKKFKI